MPTARALFAALLVAALAPSACKREERGFRVQPPSADRAGGISQTSIYPGTANPPAPTRNEYEENAHAVSEGMTLFSYYNCSGCHGSGGGGGMGPPLIDHKWIYGADPSNVFATIVEGRPNGMPSFRGRIPDYQVWQLAAYVRALGGLVPMDVPPSRPDNMSSGDSLITRDPQTPAGSSTPPSAEGRQ